jgi:hypothetical protein
MWLNQSFTHMDFVSNDFLALVPVGIRARLKKVVPSAFKFDLGFSP